MPFFRITFKQQINYTYDLVAIDEEDATKIANNMAALVMPTQQDVILQDKCTGVDRIEEINYEQFRETQIDGYPQSRQGSSGPTELPSLV